MSSREREDPGSSPGWSLLLSSARSSEVLIQAAGEFDIAAIDDVHQAVQRAAASADPPPRVVINLSRVTFLDAAMLGALVTERTALQRVGGDLVVTGVSEWSLRIIEICGLRETLGL